QRTNRTEQVHVRCDDSARRARAIVVSYRPAATAALDGAPARLRRARIASADGARLVSAAAQLLAQQSGRECELGLRLWQQAANMAARAALRSPVDARVSAAHLSADASAVEKLIRVKLTDGKRGHAHVEAAKEANLIIAHRHAQTLTGAQADRKSGA